MAQVLNVGLDGEDMSSCSRCGNKVMFRYVNGRCLPLHLNGGCVDDSSSETRDYSGRNESRDSACFRTSCPECGEGVFFIRHNEGSVWLDPPLGPPWYKHGCFDNGPAEREKPTLLADYRMQGLDIGEDEEAIIGVVRSTDVSSDKCRTEIILDTGEDKSLWINLKNNAGFLIGQLCIYKVDKKTVFPVQEPSYIFLVNKHRSLSSGLISCAECNTQLNPKKLSRHMARAHGY